MNSLVIRSYNLCPYCLQNGLEYYNNGNLANKSPVDSLICKYCGNIYLLSLTDLERVPKTLTFEDKIKLSNFVKKFKRP